MNSQEVLILFIGAVILAAATVFTLSTQIQLAASSAGSVGQGALQRVSTELRILSVYGAGTESNVVVQGVSGSMDVNSLHVLVDGQPVDPISGRFVTDRDGDGFLDQGDVYVITLPVAVDPDRNCVRVLAGAAEDLYGRCI